LRFAYVGTAYPMRGGIAQFNALLARELARTHTVDFYSFTRQYPSLLFPGKTQIETGADPAPVGARAMVDSIGPLSWIRTADAIARAQTDVVLFKYWIPFFAPCFGTIARRARKKAGTRTILICDNVIPHEKRPFDTALTRYMMDTADAFIVMSRSVIDDLRRFRPDAPARLVHHPLYTHFGEPVPKGEARRRLGWSPTERVLLFFGYIRRYKGLDLLLRAMPEIHERTGARLVVLGEFYEDRAPYDRIVTDLRLQDIVQMTGEYVPSEAVGPIFSACDATVLPYRSATQSGIIQVAYQLERPVICTRVGGLDEMLSDGATGLLVPPEDEAALVGAVRRYFDEGLEDRLVAGLRKEKASMGWDSLAGAIVELAMEVKQR
jgi:glycosyltransferase involved in cell wall biosynthesis